jgi:IclR family transcriptional regulator, acetate operon repressor
MNRTDSVAVLDKAIDLLECLLRQPDQSVAELAQAADVTKAAAYRILSTLERRGYVATYERVRRYSIGHAFRAYAQAADGPDRLIDAARPLMRTLWEETGETINLAVLAQGGVLYVDVLESAQGLRATANIGALDALHSTALGKAMMARMPPAERDAMLAEAKLVPRTKHTETNPLRLREAIERATMSGFAVDDEENEIGMRCVAASITNSDGWPLAAISISGPSSRMSHDKISVTGARLVEACAKVRNKLTGQA